MYGGGINIPMILVIASIFLILPFLAMREITRPSTHGLSDESSTLE